MKWLFTFATRQSVSLEGRSQHKRNTLLRMLLMAFVMMMLAPTAVKGATTIMNFENAGNAAYNHANNPNDGRYYANVIMSDVSYGAISGAKVGDHISAKNATTYPDIDISRLAFVFNSNAAGNTANEGAGFYLRRDADNSVKKSGLYVGNWEQKLAVLNLKPGDKVTFVYAGTVVSDNNANLHNENYNNWMTQVGKGQTATVTVDINFIGDLIVKPNKGTMIQSITIDSNVAEYDITTSGNTTTFEFTKGGYLEENDFAIPYMSVSFGNKNDYLVVGDDLQSRMFKSDGTETLETDGNIGFQPVAGNFYAFRPTGGGTVTVEGGLQGDRTHLFVYNNGWEGANGQFYKDTYNQDADHYISFSFEVEKNKTYYICINNLDDNEKGNAFHLHKFTFTNTFHLEKLAKVVDLSKETGDFISLTRIDGAQGLGTTPVKVKRCTGNIVPTSVVGSIDAYGWLNITRPTFKEGTDEAGTVILDIDTQGGEATFVVTFPYHADFNPAGYTDTNRTYGHTWNFIDPRNSDSNEGNCYIHDDYSTFNLGTTTGILSIGQYEDPSSQMRKETDNREWTYSQRQTGSAGGFHDPYYANVYEMEGDNADMIWETEGLWFETGTNLSCIYNENDAYDQSLTNPLDWAELGTDPDRYVGLMPVTDGKKSSFTIPGLKDGDRVLIFMKSGEASGANGIFLKITGAKDALGKVIDPNDLYKAGGTNWQHNRYEGCYHFIKDGDGDMTFDMQDGSMCKLLYIHIYTGQRIVTTNIVSTATGDSGRLLFMNDKGAELGSNGQGSQMSLRFRGKGQHSTNQVLTWSGNLNANSFTGDNFRVSGAYEHLIDFTSKVGELGMFRLRMNDIEYSAKYVADFCDRNFTVGYRDKVDSYPYTWDLTDIQGFSSSKMSDEASNYPIAASSQDAYGYEWDISLFDENGNMKVNTGFDPITNNLIFSPHKIGFGNQLWAGGDVIPETRGLWFYSEDDSETGYTSEYSSALYNDCLQITDDGIRFANVPDAEGKRVAWWNYKMVVPDVPADGAVYLRMKRDTSVPDDAKTWSEVDNADVPFVATRFQFASQSSKTELFTDTPVENGSGYSFYQVPDTDGEYILAVRNTTGATSHLTFTLNGWIVKKVAVSTDYKTVNKLGYATESRDREIDPELMGYLTGSGLKAYTVTGVSYGSEGEGKAPSITLTEVSSSNVIAAVNESDSHDHNAYIIYNTDAADSKAVKAINDGFHLFVPDMHDATTSGDNQKTALDVSGNMLVSMLGGGSVSQEDGDYTNYLMNYKYNDPVTGKTVEGKEEAFYRASKSASLGANKAYLQLLTKYVKPSKENPNAGAKFAIVFVNEEEGSQTTSLDGVNATETLEGNNAVYTLSGVRVEKPAKGGIYIKNGKKFIVK